MTTIYAVMKFSLICNDNLGSLHINLPNYVTKQEYDKLSNSDKRFYIIC